jgi:hypothetical protein
MGFELSKPDSVVVNGFVPSYFTSSFDAITTVSANFVKNNKSLIFNIDLEIQNSIPGGGVMDIQLPNGYLLDSSFGVDCLVGNFTFLQFAIVNLPDIIDISLVPGFGPNDFVTLNIQTLNLITIFKGVITCNCIVQ